MSSCIIFLEWISLNVDVYIYNQNESICSSFHSFRTTTPLFVDYSAFCKILNMPELFGVWFAYDKIENFMTSRNMGVFTSIKRKAGRINTSRNCKISFLEYYNSNSWTKNPINHRNIFYFQLIFFLEWFFECRDVWK